MAIRKSRFDPQKVFPPDEFDCYKHVAVFDEHEANGTRQAVSRELLGELADNCNRKFANVGAAVPLTLGHTKDDADEKDQPDIVGWAANFDVENLLDTGKKALFADFYVRKKYGDVIEKCPHRSVELWRSKKDISPIALLKTTPERDLPIIRYAAEPTDDDPVTYYFSIPEKPVAMNPTEQTMMNDATLGATSSMKEVGAKIDALTELFQQFMMEFQALLQDEGGGDGGDKGDLLAPEPEETPEPMPKEMPEKSDAEEPVPDEKNAKMESALPEKSAAMASPSGTNAYVPGMKGKDKMSRDAEVEKFQRELKAEIEKAVKPTKEKAEKLEKENAELRQHYRRTEAEKLVKELEEKHEVDFGDEKEKEAEIELFAALSKESVPVHFDRVVKKYKKKKPAQPDSAGALRALQYARLPDAGADAIKDPMEANRRAEEILKSGMGYEEYLRKQGQKK